MYKILSVDDEPINQVIVEELLSTQFEIALRSSGEECLAQINDIQPNLILLDVSMPGIDGYQTCRELKANSNTQHIPIIFVSARNTLEDQIQAYEAGGQDYITKPFNHSELVAKIVQLIESENHLTPNGKRSAQGHKAPSMATDTVPADFDAVMHFFDCCLTCRSFTELGNSLLNTCEQLQLQCIIQFRSNTGPSHFASHQWISPLELSLFEQTREKDRFYDFNSGLIITFPHVSLLLKHPPAIDDGDYGHLKVLLGVLLSSVEVKLRTLINDTLSK